MEPIQDDRPRTISDDATLVEWACGASSPSPAAHEALIRILHRLGDVEAERDRLLNEQQEAGWVNWDKYRDVRDERDRLKEKADYWERQYVIESENADDFHAERDRLIQALERERRNVLPDSSDEAMLDRIEALTKTTEEDRA
jgi:hypothetical protein